MSESARIFVLARNRKTGAVTYSGTYGQREEWHDSNATQEVRVITVGAMWDAAPKEYTTHHLRGIDFRDVATVEGKRGSSPLLTFKDGREPVTLEWYSRLQRAVERGPGKSTGKEWDKYLNKATAWLAMAKEEATR